MDSTTEKAIIVHKKNGDQMKFVESISGLYYYDCEADFKLSKAQIHL